jgi:hypothetical protein
VAKIDGVPVLSRGELKRWLSRRPGRPVADVVDELVNLHLFAGVAAAEGFKPPAAPTEADARADATTARLELGEAWARATFVGPEPTDAELTAWFVERRAVARIVVKSPEAAETVLAAMREPAPADTGEAIRRFAKLSREHNTEKTSIAPRRTLFDAAGRSELGEPVVHEAVATAAFALAKDGDVSGVVKLGDSGDLAIVQRIAHRPAMKPAEVPPPDLERAKEGLRAASANALMKARAGELRAKVTIAVEPQTFSDLRATPMKGRFVKGLGGRPDARAGRASELKAVMREPPSRELPQLTREQILDAMKKQREGGGGQP